MVCGIIVSKEKIEIIVLLLKYSKTVKFETNYLVRWMPYIFFDNWKVIFFNYKIRSIGKNQIEDKIKLK